MFEWYQAHQSLVDLENSRDDLLFELHRIGHKNPRDRKDISHADTCLLLYRCHLGLV
jgi:hypothetical protein